MPRGVYNRNKAGVAKAAPVSHEDAGTAYDPGAAGYELQGRKSSPSQDGVGPVAEAAPNVEAPVRAVAMELNKNYCPKELLRIVGWQKPAVLRKNAAGQMVEVERAEFIEGEMKPPVYPGTGFDNKIWAGTVIEVPEAEAKEMRSRRIAEAYL